MRRLLAAALLLAGLAPAQSSFNTQGLGEIGRAADARSAGLGASAALDWHNPAWLVELPRTRISATLLAAGTIGREDIGNRLVGTVRPAGFYGAVPLPLGGRLALGLDESFNHDFDIWTESLPNNPYRYHVNSRGGIYALKAGLAWSFLDAGCIGVEYARQLGAARENWRLEASGGTYISVDTVETDYTAHRLKAGAAAELGRFGAGAWFAPGYDLRVVSIRRVHGVISDSLSSRLVGIPWTAAGGISVAALDRLTFSAGAEYRPWSGITVDSGPSGAWRDALRLSGGLQFAFDTLHVLRLGYSGGGLYYDVGWRQPYQVDLPVTEHRLHLGTALPVTGFGALDVAVEVARRSSNVLSEYSARLLVTLAYREAWQRRTRRWGY
jgi:hypothetical protein